MLNFDLFDLHFNSINDLPVKNRLLKCRDAQICCSRLGCYGFRIISCRLLGRNRGLIWAQAACQVSDRGPVRVLGRLRKPLVLRHVALAARKILRSPRVDQPHIKPGPSSVSYSATQFTPVECVTTLQTLEGGHLLSCHGILHSLVGFLPPSAGWQSLHSLSGGVELGLVQDNSPPNC